MIAITIVGSIVVIFAICLIVVGTNGLRTQWKIARRKMRALQSGATHDMIYVNEYQPLNDLAGFLEPLKFEATRPCPHCGFFDTHMMSEPKPDRWNLRQDKYTGKWRPVTYAPWVRPREIGDHPEAATIRNCKRCGHVWGEK